MLVCVVINGTTHINILFRYSTVLESLNLVSKYVNTNKFVTSLLVGTKPCQHVPTEKTWYQFSWYVV